MLSKLENVPFSLWLMGANMMHPKADSVLLCSDISLSISGYFSLQARAVRQDRAYRMTCTQTHDNADMDTEDADVDKVTTSLSYLPNL